MHHSFGNISSTSSAQTPTVFLPGCGFDGRVLGLIAPQSHWLFPQTMIDPHTLGHDLSALLEGEDVGPARIIGWSMGARLALDFATSHPQKVASLTLVSMRHHWPKEEIDQLLREFTEDPPFFLKNFYRKCFLGEKLSYKKFTQRLELYYLENLDDFALENLQRGLRYLGKADCQAAPGIPTRLVHGRQDIIAPVSEIAILPDAVVEIIDNCGHLPFLAADCSLQTELKHQAIQKKFSRAAHTYDRFAIVQSDVAKQLAAMLPPPKDSAETSAILEIGCGTGNFTKILADRFPDARIQALDFSPEMLDQGRLKQQKKDIEFICDEAENFLLNSSDESFDLVASNGALQWFSDLDGALKNIARILRPKGIFLCSIFGPASLKELELGLKTVFKYQGNVAAGSFPDAGTLQKSVTAYFMAGAVEEELITKQYETVHDLLVHIKKTGTGGWQHNILQPLTPAKLKQLDHWFNETYGNCRVTYQVLFLQAMK
jgi:malonyl-CoA O-methyltransferase